MPISKSPCGKTTDGQAVELYTLTNAQGASAKVISYGAILTELHIPDKQGKLANVVLGFPSLDSYLQTHPFFGATTGRYANRISNGQFVLDGKTYTLPKNDHGIATLHGGTRGIDKYVWSAASNGNTLTFTLLSPAGDNGFPGNLKLTATYTLTDKNELVLTFGATTDAPTPVNLCNHSYFNLAGAGAGTILNHTMQINAKSYTPTDANLLPTGEIAPVAGTPLDFTTPTAIGARIAQLAKAPGGGYDNNFVINHAKPGDLTLAATATDPASGRIMDVLTTQPAIQLYTANFLDGTLTGNGGKYVQYGGFCLETQDFPDSVNHPNFPNTIIRPGQPYHHQAIYRFRNA